MIISEFLRGGAPENNAPVRVLANSLNNKIFLRTAFTLAEVLITLGIIGIVAAMTLPSLIGNYQKKVTVNKLKKAYTILNQAFKRSQIDNGDYQYWAKGVDMGIDAYYKLYWHPYFQITTVCDNYQKCGYKEERPWLGANNEKLTALFSHKYYRIPFLTSDGILYSFSIASGNANNSFQVVWVDINGPKNPNQYGIDVFLFAPTEGNVIMPYCYNSSESSINKECSKNGTGDCCAARIMADGWEIKGDYPWK